MASEAQAVQQIHQLQQAGQPEKALQHCSALQQQYPDSPELLTLKAILSQQLQDFQGAQAAMEQRVKLQPTDHAAHCDLAGLLFRNNDLGNSEHHARQALALNPQNPQAHNLLGQIMARQYLFEEAVFHYRQVLLLHEPVAAICTNLGNALMRLGQLDEAEQTFMMGYQLEPQDLILLLSWVRMEEARGKLPQAAELLQLARQISPRDATLLIIQARLNFRQKQFDQAENALQQLISVHGEPDNNYEYYFILGAVLDARARYPEAMQAYHKGNQLIRQVEGFEYQHRQQEQLFSRLHQAFSKPVQNRTTPEKTIQNMPDPVFILGFPRSGTTLTEQILSSHKQLAAGDELSYISRATRLAGHLTNTGQPYPECLTQIDWASPAGKAVQTRFRSYYLQNVISRGICRDGERLFTDKMPLNEVHLGLIQCIFPEAPLIQVIRHPLDVVLSSYFNQLTHGGNCSFNLINTADHYLKVYHLVQQYRRNLPLNIHQLKYEALIADPETQIKQLLEFIGLPWDDACLAFSQNRRYARTASYAQVTEQLYQGSRYRFRHYTSELQQARDILAPVITELGYPLH